MSSYPRAFHNFAKAARAALGVHGFVGHTAELLGSPAWLTRPINVVRLINFLECEHLRHGGQENGYLTATYDQLVECGIGRRFIKDTLEAAVSRGLVEVTHYGSRRGVKSDASQFRITYLPSKFKPVVGATEYHAPTNEWRHYDGEKIVRAQPQKLGKTVGRKSIFKKFDSTKKFDSSSVQR